MKCYKYTFVWILVLFLSFKTSGAQDAHFSQYFVSEPILNPALTGVFSDADMRAIAQYRSQWGLLGSKFTTAAFSYDMPLKEKWGVGGYLMNADASSIFNTFSFTLSGSYEITDPNQEKHLLTTGFQLGLLNKQARSVQLLFDNQFTGENFDPDVPNGEEANSQRLSKMLPEVNFGLYYKYKDDTRMVNPFFGFSLFHVTSPNESFLSGKSNLPRRYVVHTGSAFNISDPFSLTLHALYMRQGNAQEINGGIEGSYLLNQDQQTTLHIGGYYRMGDAMIFSAGLTSKNFTYRLSYDANVSKLESFSNGVGGIELTLVYKK